MTALGEKCRTTAPTGCDQLRMLLAVVPNGPVSMHTLVSGEHRDGEKNTSAEVGTIGVDSRSRQETYDEDRYHSVNNEIKRREEKTAEAQHMGERLELWG